MVMNSSLRHSSNLAQFKTKGAVDVFLSIQNLFKA